MQIGINDGAQGSGQSFRRNPHERLLMHLPAHLTHRGIDLTVKLVRVKMIVLFVDIY